MSEMASLRTIMKLDPPEEIPVTNRIRRWAARNSYTLLFLSFMFFVTWLIEILIGLRLINGLHN